METQLQRNKKRLSQFKAGYSFGYLRKSASLKIVLTVSQIGGGNQNCSRSSRPEICAIVRPTVGEYSDALQMQAANTGGSSTLAIQSKLHPKNKKKKTDKEIIETCATSISEENTGLENFCWTYSSCGTSGLNFSLVLTPVELVLKSGILKETKHVILHGIIKKKFKYHLNLGKP